MNIKFVNKFDHTEIAYEILDIIPRTHEKVVLNGTVYFVESVKYNIENIKREGGDQVIIELI